MLQLELPVGKRVTLLLKVSDGAKKTSLRLHCSLVAILCSQSSAARVVNVWAPGLIGGLGMVMPQTVLLVILGGKVQLVVLPVY